MNYTTMEFFFYQGIADGYGGYINPKMSHAWCENNQTALEASEMYKDGWFWGQAMKGAL